jgi:hypothetical protein
VERRLHPSLLVVARPILARMVARKATSGQQGLMPHIMANSPMLLVVQASPGPVQPGHHSGDVAIQIPAPPESAQ